ncbi:MAG: ACP S-malonyltransferase [Deltaproteobacteria bacterium]|nr:ACP S-malonyltransferase [Deltaproteobacteria bacterium]
MLALLFPGQGSQSVGMGRDVFQASPAARAVFEAADEALERPLSKLCFEGPDAALVPTEVQQPAILTVSVALLRALEERCAVAPAFVAGHSLGEYSALVASGALAFEDGVRLVAARGRFMQETVPAGVGAMAAILKSTPEAVEAACKAATEATGRMASPANYNAPAQTVIAGHAEAVDAAGALLAEGGARVRPLSVSAPFHCSLMAPAAERLSAELARTPFVDPDPPVVGNVEAEPNASAGRIAGLLERQVTAPVRFVESIQRLSGLGVTHTLEVGPGRVLSGLVARIERGLERANLGAADDLDGAAAFVSAAQD